MKLKKMIAFGMALLLLAMACAGCSVQRYDAEIYSYVNDWLDPAFLENNRLGNVNYTNPDYDLDLDETAEAEGWEYEVPPFFCYPDNPNTRTFIITDEETFDSMFVEDTIEVNFEKEMVLLYMFETGTLPSIEYKIEEITVEEEEITVTFKQAWDWEIDVKNARGSIYPYHRCIAVKMEKVDVSTVNFIKE